MNKNDIPLEASEWKSGTIISDFIEYADKRLFEVKTYGTVGYDKRNLFNDCQPYKLDQCRSATR
ncbi:MAG: hypothetical protein ACYC64_09955 [Armatimonadota bacterium]